MAQTPPVSTAASATADAWQRCTALVADKDERLACFDRWAADQSPGAATASASATTKAAPPSAPVDSTLPATRIIGVAATEGCRDKQYSDLSRFWELEVGTDCGTFGIRGYRPISLSVVSGSNVNKQPSSPAPDHGAPAPIDYSSNEVRIQISLRTKIAQGLLTSGHPTLQDSLWFGYTAQSYWQIFSPELSRPFRATDHEPELIYVYPTDAQLPLGWRWRYSGLGLVHQSNGQSLPLSRSWNRVYLMTGMEKGADFRLNARIWKRIAESADDDENPGISNYIGRAELQGTWNVNQDNTLSATVRSSLSASGRGSVRLEWLRALHSDDNGTRSGLRFHTQIFSGYGDSLIDYNRHRTVFSVGLSLLDF
ncbi:phospholipase A [Ramlibacter sp. H39-3-26]|nr:phospholipase A [Ramlibacter sp. H39-3-26]MDF1486275.1 phospholipase A [Ramlibacter sp. H39-3-26]